MSVNTLEDVLNGAVSALARIRRADGYRTDAGLQPILRNVEQIDEGTPLPALSIFPLDENVVKEHPNTHHRDVAISLLIYGWATVFADEEGPQDEDERRDDLRPLLDLRQDVLRALFRYGSVPEFDGRVIDYRYVGWSQMPRAPGSNYVQVVFEGYFKWRECV